MPRRPKRVWKRAYSPTEEEISAACQEIRKDETEKELMRRAGMSTEAYTIPEVCVPQDVAEKLNLSRAEADIY